MASDSTFGSAGMRTLMAVGFDLIWEIERELAGGRGDAYERHLAAEAIVVVPGMTLDKAATVDAMDASPGWDEWSFAEETVRELGDDGVVLNYRFAGRRGETAYAAVLTSVYRRDGDEEPKLVLHQQTPISRSRTTA